MSARSYFPGAAGSAVDETRHFRAHPRRPVHLGVTLRAERAGWERSGVVVDISLAGAGVETDEALTPGERVSVAFATPTLWDPLVLTAVIVWAQPVRVLTEAEALAHPRVGSVGPFGQRSSARSGLAFDYPNPDATLAMFEMLVAIGFE